MKLHFTCAALLLTMACIVPAAAWAAQSGEAARYPSRPVRIVIGFTPGGTPDITSRMIGAKLTESLGQQFIVDNRPGAGGTIGGKIVADANADGYTLLSVSASHVLQPSIYARMPYDTLRDFAGITRTSTACYLLVTSPSFEARSAKALIALARAKPGQLNFASAGSGSGTHFAGEMFKHAAGIDAVHVPYKGIPESLNDVIAGRVQFFMSPLSSSIPLVKAGKLRALGVSCTKRVAAIPDVPTLGETALPGFRFDTWSGILAPAKTPRAIVNKLHAEITRILARPEIHQKMTALGVEPDPTTPAAFDKLIAGQLAVMARLARQAGIRPQ